MMNAVERLMKLKRPGAFEYIDLELARLVTERAGMTDSPPLAWATVLASLAVRRGHSCCDLKRFAGRRFPEGAAQDTLRVPSFAELAAALKQAAASGMAALETGTPVKSEPLVLNAEGLLYLNRYYRYECLIASELARRCARPDRIPEAAPGYPRRLSKRFRRPSPDGEPDYQQAAVFLAHARDFAVITGGPGTGKTTVLAALLAWELEEDPAIRIELCAPTGKAQARMKESIVSELVHLDCSPETARRLSELPCRTIDSLLETRPGSPVCRRNAENPLAADLVVVDEVSMASLALLGHLFQALKPQTRLVLIGDKDQLSPVEAGSVLSDLIASGTPNVMPKSLAAAFERATGRSFPVCADDSPLSGSIVELRINYRARSAPALSALAAAMRRLSVHPEETEAVCARMLAGAGGEFTCRVLPAPAAFEDAVRQFIWRKSLELPGRPGELYAPADLATAAAAGTDGALDLAFGILDSFRILCAIRKGPYGQETINAFLSAELGLLSEESPGRPLLIGENTPAKGLSNGDVGLVWQRRGDSRACAVFRAQSPGMGAPGYRFLPLAELPLHETVFAMTVHKAQGSGFQRVMAVLPPFEMSLLTRELIYTALTRAERGVLLYADEKILRRGLMTKTVRYSGLTRRLEEIKGKQDES